MSTIINILSEYFCHDILKENSMDKNSQLDSKLKKYDTNQDNILDESEIEAAEKIKQIENADRKENAQRRMAWVALGGMITYPLITMGMSAFGLDASILSSMADLYFISVAGIVAAFYGKEAYMSKHNGSKNSNY
jgi:hypothetical protein